MQLIHSSLQLKGLREYPQHNLRHNGHVKSSSTICLFLFFCYAVYGNVFLMLSEYTKPLTSSREALDPSNPPLGCNQQLLILFKGFKSMHFIYDILVDLKC